MSSQTDRKRQSRDKTPDGLITPVSKDDSFEDSLLDYVPPKNP